MEFVHLMNELNLGVSIEGADELIASYSELMLNVDLIDIKKENKTPPEAKGDEYQSPPMKTLTMKGMKEALDHLDKFLSIMEECDPFAESSLKVQRAVDRDTACYRHLCQEKKKVSIQLSLDHFVKEFDKLPSASIS